MNSTKVVPDFYICTMTADQVEELIGYFQHKKLPNTFTYPGGTINNCQTFVDAQIYRMHEGVPLIKQCSYDLLKAFRDKLETVAG